MKVPRSYVGQMVEITWKDPRGFRLACRQDELPKGFAALATWRERGIIDDLTDGVVRVIHAEALNPIDPDDSASKPEYNVSWIPEVLIETIVLYKSAQAEVTPIS